MKKKFIVPVLALALGTSSLAGCKSKPAPKPQPAGKALSSIAITQNPTTTTYEFDVVSVSLEGMEVTAYFSDETNQVLQSSEYQTTSLEPTAIQKASGTFTVTVSYTYNSVKKSAPVNFTINPAPQADWKDDELALMREKLEGQTFPFIELGDDYEVEWDDSQEMLYIEGGDVDQAALAAYARKMNNSGWQCGEQTQSEGVKVYTFSKQIAREGDAPIMIQGSFYAADSSYTPAASGMFALGAKVEASFDKDWPTAKVADLVKDWAASTEVAVPSFDADYYKVSAMTSTTYGSITGYGLAEDPSAAYEAKLTGWNLDKSQTYPYALSPDESFGIMYVYTASSKTFTIIVTEARATYTYWPQSRVDGIVAAYAHGDAAPSFTGEAAAAVTEFSVNGDVVIMKVEAGNEAATISAFAAQQTTYTESVYQYWTDGTVMLVSPNLNIMVWIWQQKAGQINVQFVPFKIRDKMAKAGLTEFLPSSMELASTADGQDMSYNCYELKQESSAAVATKIAEFENDLLAAGFLPHASGTSTYYVSPNQTIMVGMSAYQTYVDIYVYSGSSISSMVYPTSAGFPSEAIATFLDADHAAVPALADAAAYLIPEASGFYNVYARFATEAAATEALAAYVASADFVANYDEVGEGTGVYNSKDSTTGITISRVGCYVFLSIQDIDVFPLAALNAFLDESFTSENIPVVEKQQGMKFASSSNPATGEFTISITYASAEDATQGQSDYVTALGAKDFTETSEGSGIYRNTSLALDVAVSKDDKVLSLVFSSLYKALIDVEALGAKFGIPAQYCSYLPGLYVKLNSSEELSINSSVDNSYVTYYSSVTTKLDDVQALVSELEAELDANAMFSEIDDDVYYSNTFGLVIEFYPAYGTSLSNYRLVAKVYSVPTYYLSQLNSLSTLSVLPAIAAIGGSAPAISYGRLGQSGFDIVSFAYSYEQGDGESADDYAARIAAAKAQFIASLTSAGYTYDSDFQVYVHASNPNIYVAVDDTNNGFEASFENTSYFNALNLYRATSYLNSFFEVEDYKTKVPSIQGFSKAIAFGLSGSETSLSVSFKFKASGSGQSAKTAEQNAQEAYDAYIASLTSTEEGGYGFVKHGDDDYYVSADGNYKAEVVLNGAVMTLTITYIGA